MDGLHEKEVTFMRRLLVAMSLALVASLALSGVAFATHSPTINDGGQQRDFVAGSGTLAQPFAAFRRLALAPPAAPLARTLRGSSTYATRISGRHMTEKAT